MSHGAFGSEPVVLRETDAAADWIAIGKEHVGESLVDDRARLFRGSILAENSRPRVIARPNARK